MFELMVMWCLISDPTICTRPVEVLPQSGEITSVGMCLRGGAIYSMEKGKKWASKIYCKQKSLSDFRIWLHRESKKSRIGQADGVPRSPWN